MKHHTDRTPDSEQQFTAEQQERLTTLLEAHSEQLMGFPEAAGLLFAVVSCPQPIMPSEWTKAILGDFEFADMDQAQTVVADLMALNDWIISRLDQGYSPLPPGCEPAQDPQSNFDEKLPFNRWTQGFAEGHGWLEAIWEACESEAEDSGMSLMCLTCFTRRKTAEAYHREIFENRVTLDQMIDAAHEMIPQALQDYYQVGRQLRHSGIVSPGKPVRSTRIGRNEPCPCGSGRKYKKCCGQPGGPTSTSIH